MTDQNDWTRLARYFAGECTPEEVEEIRAWLEADPERQRLADELRPAWDAAATSNTTWDTPASWQRLTARLRARERRAAVALVQPAHGRARWGRRWWPAAVAAAAVTLAAGGLLWHMNEGRSAAATAAADLREVRTVARQALAMRLADGSRVVLAPGSVLRYDAARFGVSTRELHLQGRAYFDVTHDARRPFFVRTARSVTEDLGTTFIISDYPGDPATEVAVTSGVVAVRSATGARVQPATVLTGGELMQLDGAGNAAVRRGLDLASRVAWTEGRLVFIDTPVREVLAELGHWYGIDVRLSDTSMVTQRFTASYTSQPDSVVVHELATAIGARVTRRGRLFLLYRTPDPS